MILTFLNFRVTERGKTGNRNAQGNWKEETEKAVTAKWKEEIREKEEEAKK